MEEEALTLKELLDRLAPLVAEYGDKAVVLEGCDCDGLCGGIEAKADSRGVVLTRSRYED